MAALALVTQVQTRSFPGVPAASGHSWAVGRASPKPWPGLPGRGGQRRSLQHILAAPMPLAVLWAVAVLSVVLGGVWGAWLAFHLMESKLL